MTTTPEVAITMSETTWKEPMSPGPRYGQTPFFSTYARLGRMRYVIWHAMALVILIVSAAVLFLIFLPFESASGATGLQDTLLLIGIAADFLFFFLSCLTLNMRRLHDMDLQGWLAGLVYIPVGGALFKLMLFCSNGTGEKNKYGLPPPPNSRTAKALFIVSLLFMVSLLAFLIILALAH
jgi:uncharacterized membrane protein YhaH (DUF805 family)